MIDSDERRQALKQAYGFDDWPQGNASPVLAGSPVLDLDQAPLSLIERTPLPDGAYKDVYGAGKTILASVWVHNCGAPGRAREALVDYLMRHTDPDLPHAAGRGVAAGDVAFMDNQDPPSSIAFIRGPFLARVHSLGENPYPVEEMALVLDALFTAELEPDAA